VSIPASSLALGSADYTWRKDAIYRDTLETNQDSGIWGGTS